MQVKATLSVRPVTVALASFGLFAMVQSAHAATYTVTNTNDSGAGSLRDAIAQANANPGADSIVFSGVTGTITLTTGELAITDSVTITGPGAASLSISGNNASRVFQLGYSESSTARVVTISDLSVVNGASNLGGGMFVVDGTINLNRVRFANNSATVDGGGLFADGFRVTLSISDCTFSGNSASGKGGAIYVEDTGGPLTISRSVFSGNSATRGGAIYLYDPDRDVTVDQSVFMGNSATEIGGAFHLYSIDRVAPLTISNSVFSSNTAPKGGAIYVEKLDTPTVIANSTFTSNSATGGAGGAILVGGVGQFSTFTIRETTIIGNSATTNGGGISAGNAFDAVTLINTVTAGNTAAANADAGGSLVISANNSLIQSTTLSITNNGGVLQNVAANVGPLSDNGGPSVGAPGFTAVLQSRLPNVGSPLIDAGTASGVSSTDQRGTGFPRVVGAAPDIGAVELELFPITEVIAPTGGGTLVCTPDPVPRGGSTTCVATPNTGYSFVSLSGDCAAATPSCTISNVTSAKTVTATFALNSYSVTEVIAPVGGGTLVCTPDPVPHGSSTTCVATPSAGYSLVGLTGDCTSATGSCTMTNVTSAKSVTATFALSAYPITINVAPTVGGSVVCTPNPVSHGQNVTCTATANAGYTFAGFSGDCSGSTCTLSNVTGSRTVNAAFSAIPPVVVSVFSAMHALIMVGLIGLAAGLRRRRH